MDSIKTIHAILFDWDGTLLDSFAPAYNAFRRVLKRYRLEITPQLFRNCYSPDWHVLYEKLGLPRSEWEKADLLWSNFYAEEKPQLVKGALEAVKHLHAASYRIGIVTSGYRARVENEISELGLGQFISILVCGDDASYKKPDPAIIQSVLDRLGVGPSKAVLVGDSPADIRMGKKLGLHTIGVQSPYSTEELLARESPDALVSGIDGLIARLL